MSVLKNGKVSYEVKSRSILEMPADEARTFLLKEESYYTIDLPPYIRFKSLIERISKVLEDKMLSDLQHKRPRFYDDVNHSILNNKDGRHAWRPLQLIHPALYVSLVHRITERENWDLILVRFKEFFSNENIKCMSLPLESSLIDEKDKAAQISHWWHQVEQASIELALDFEYIIHTDVVDCYGDIYTHSIAWALHTKPTAKKERNKKKMLIGNLIDGHIQDMRYGQSNGIPQGSVLMDFIAEMVLGYADNELTKRIENDNIKDYRILRYRDDYRIFVNSSLDGERLLKALTEVMIDLGLKLSAAKTEVSNHVVTSSLKEGKLGWICGRQGDKDLQRHLVVIHNHSMQYPNAGSLMRPLENYRKRLEKTKCYNPLSLISIVVDIAYRNPKTYSLCANILSKLLSLLPSADKKKTVIEQARKKFSRIPNTGHMQIWLQRISLKTAPDMDFDEPLCRLVSGKDVSIWNSDWVSSTDLKKALVTEPIIDAGEMEQLDEVAPPEEITLFVARGEYNS